MRYFLSLTTLVLASTALAQETLDIPFEPLAAPGAESETLIEINPEEDFWAIVNESRTPADLDRYLAAYPDGAYRGEAEARVEAATAERKLKLRSRTRREVQELLLLLGHEPNGRDGVFGAGARKAIAAWQEGAERLDTGYLDQDELDALRADAVAYAATISKEAESRVAERASQRQADWEALGLSELLAPLAEYVSSHPFGPRSEAALAALAVLGEVAAGDTGEDTLTDWRAAQETGTAEGWELFMEAHPDGALAEVAKAEAALLIARNTIANPKGGDSGDFAAPTLAWAEALLVKGNYGQMTVDGQVTDKTRAAIAAFQDIHALEVTGDLDASTMSLLIAEQGR